MACLFPTKRHFEVRPNSIVMSLKIKKASSKIIVELAVLLNVITVIYRSNNQLVREAKQSYFSIATGLQTCRYGKMNITKLTMITFIIF